MSIGVLHKWGKKYFTDSNDKHVDLAKLYKKIMHELYPEMEEYTPLEFTIIDELI